MPKLSDHIHESQHDGIRAGTTTLLVIPAGGIEPDSIMLRHRIVEDEYRVKFAEPESLDSEWITCPFRIGSTHYIEDVGRIRVTAIDFKPLQEISEEEALEAGVMGLRAMGDSIAKNIELGHGTPQSWYWSCVTFWNKLSWEANPMCWYVSIEKEGGSDA